MARSKVSIVNSALTSLGAELITSLNDTSTEAVRAKKIFDNVLEEVLRQHPWNCAAERVSLAALSEEPAWGFDRQFQIPADALRVLSLEDKRISFRLEGRKILTDADAPLNVLIIKKITDMNALDSHVAEVLAAKLAYELAETLTGSTDKQNQMLQIYEKKLRDARYVDATETSTLLLEAEDWLESRFGDELFPFV